MGDNGASGDASINIDLSADSVYDFPPLATLSITGEQVN